MAVKPGDMFNIPLGGSAEVPQDPGYTTCMVVCVDQGDIRRGLTPAKPAAVYFLTPEPKVIKRDFLWLAQFCHKVA